MGIKLMGDIAEGMYQRHLVLVSLYKIFHIVNEILFFLHFLHTLPHIQESTFWIVQKWSWRPVLDNSKMWSWCRNFTTHVYVYKTVQVPSITEVLLFKVKEHRAHLNWKRFRCAIFRCCHISAQYEKQFQYSLDFWAHKKTFIHQAFW